MKLKTKLMSALIMFCICTCICVMAVFALKEADITAGGSIKFYPKGVEATISQGTLSSTGSHVDASHATSKMQPITITKTTTEQQLDDASESWQGLDLLFNEAGDDVTISFTITNNFTNAEDKIYATITTKQGTATNATISASPTSATIEAGATQTIVITFSVTTKTEMASLLGFEIIIDLSLEEQLNVADYMKEDTENQYYYVEMGETKEWVDENGNYVESDNIIPIRWRYASADGITPYDYSNGMPTSMKGYYVLETDIYYYMLFKDTIDNYENGIYANDYALSNLRSYLTGDEYLTKYNISEDNAIYSHITPQSLSSLYSDIWTSGEDISVTGYDIFLPIPSEYAENYTNENTDPNFNIATDKFFAPSYREIKNFELSENWTPDISSGSGRMEGWWFRSIHEAGNVIGSTEWGAYYPKMVNNHSTAPRAAFCIGISLGELE